MWAGERAGPSASEGRRIGVAWPSLRQLLVGGAWVSLRPSPLALSPPLFPLPSSDGPPTRRPRARLRPSAWPWRESVGACGRAGGRARGSEGPRRRRCFASRPRQVFIHSPEGQRASKTVQFEGDSVCCRSAGGEGGRWWSVVVARAWRVRVCAFVCMCARGLGGGGGGEEVGSVGRRGARQCWLSSLVSR